MRRCFRRCLGSPAGGAARCVKQVLGSAGLIAFIVLGISSSVDQLRQWRVLWMHSSASAHHAPPTSHNGGTAAGQVVPLSPLPPTRLAPPPPSARPPLPPPCECPVASHARADARAPLPLPCTGAGTGWALERSASASGPTAGADWIDLAWGRPMPSVIRGKHEGASKRKTTPLRWSLEGTPSAKGLTGRSPPEGQDRPLVALPPAPSPTGPKVCRYHRMTPSEARCALGGLRIAFIGDSLLRNLFENFALLLRGPILPLDSNRLGKKEVKWGDFLQIDEASNVSMVFHWAPLVSPPDEADPVQGQIMPRPFAAALAGLLANGQGKRNSSEHESPHGTRTAGRETVCPAWLDGIDWNGFKPAANNDRSAADKSTRVELPRAEFEGEAKAGPFVYDERPLPNGGGWLSYCTTPDVVSTLQYRFWIAYAIYCLRWCPQPVLLCSLPPLAHTQVVLNYGLWHKGNHARNLAMLEAQLERHWGAEGRARNAVSRLGRIGQSKQGDMAHGGSNEAGNSDISASDRNSTQNQISTASGVMTTRSPPPPLLILVLPWRVRRHWSRAQGSTQRDPELATAEPQYVPKTLRNIGLELTRMCQRFAPHCYTLDAWQLSYGRAKDSEDGRHFDFDTPSLNTIMSLMVNAVGMLVPPGGTGANAPTSTTGQQGHGTGCCGIRHVPGPGSDPCKSR